MRRNNQPRREAMSAQQQAAWQQLWRRLLAEPVARDEQIERLPKASKR